MRIGLNSLLMKRIPDGLFEPSEIVIVQPKCDGIWFEVEPKTLNGKTRDDHKYNLSNITTPFASVAKEAMGELVYTNPDTGAITRDRSKVMSVLLKQQNWEEYAKHIRMLIFDVNIDPPDDELTTWLQYRIKYIDNLKHPFFRPMPSCQIEFKYIYDIVRQMDNDPKYEKLEGVVIRRLNAPQIMTYKTKEFIHPDMFKLKPVYDATLRCVACKPHSKNPEWIGALILETSDKKLRIAVGSGLDKEMRQQPFSDFKGKLIEIEFENISATGEKLSHPRILKKPIRYDLQEADSFEKLQIRSSKFII